MAGATASCTVNFSHDIKISSLYLCMASTDEYRSVVGSAVNKLVEYVPQNGFLPNLVTLCDSKLDDHSFVVVFQMSITVKVNYSQF